MQIDRNNKFGHMQAKHSTQPVEKEQCPICNHWLKKSAIKIHIANHADQGANCKICGRYLKSSASMPIHIRAVHSEQSTRHKCETCGKGFFRKKKLLEHIAVHHTREFLYKCRVCGKEFRQEVNWKCHEKKNHPEEYDKIFKPFYKWAPHEKPPEKIDEALRNLNSQIGGVEELFEGL